MKITYFLTLSIFTAFCGFVSAQTLPTPRTKVYRDGDYVVKQFVVPGFETLPLSRKLFIYHLAQAAQAGNDITWHQATREGLNIRNALEVIWGKRENLLNSNERTNLARYLFELYTEHGNYGWKSNEKILLKGFNEERLLQIARASGIEAQVRPLVAELLDPEYKKLYLSDSATEDKILTSRSNFYGPGVTEAHVAQLPTEVREAFYSYPYLQENGQVTSAPIRIGGKYSEYLVVIRAHFLEALKYATPEEKDVIEKYLRTFETGTNADLKIAETAWTRNENTKIEFAINFIETYLDPLDKRGEFIAFLLLTDQTPETLARVSRIRANAPYFESQMPVAQEFKKTGEFTPPQASGAYFIHTSGGVGGKPFLGVNLPNDNSIRETYGSKSFTMLNSIAEINPSSADLPLEFGFFHSRYQEQLKTFDYEKYVRMQIEFHEILGHGSGKLLPGIQDQVLVEFGSPLEEGRAEAASIFYMTDPKLMELGILTHVKPEEFKTFSELAYVAFFAEHFYGYSKLTDTATAIKSPHILGRQIFVNRLLDAGVLVVTFTQEGFPQVEITDMAKAHQIVGETFRDFQRLKSTGNYLETQKLFEREGQYTARHQEIRAGILKYIAAKNLPSKAFYLNPRMVLQRDKDGNIRDVKLNYTYQVKGLEPVISAQIRRHAKNARNLSVFSNSLMCQGLFAK